MLHVCTSCRLPGSENADGARLLALIQAQDSVGEFTVNGVECMSGCNRACTIGLSAPGKISYLFGDLAPDPATATQALELAALYRNSADGLLVRADRPPAFRAGILARIPSP